MAYYPKPGKQKADARKHDQNPCLNTICAAFVSKNLADDLKPLTGETPEVVASRKEPTNFTVGDTLSSQKGLINKKKPC